MPCLTDVLQVIAPDVDETPEDIFASAPGLIFTDDIVNLHGSPDATIVYKNSRFGSLELRTADPYLEHERTLFSHYLWNAGLKLAELISHDPDWSVHGETVLELGAGVGLAGIVSALAGARETVLTDYPSQVVLDKIAINVKKNMPAATHAATSIHGHEWGMLETDFAVEYRRSFTRVLAADCFWMPHQHANLVKSMLYFLADTEVARIFVVSGFHTGRAKLAAFFAVAQASSLVVEEIYEEHAEGARRVWDPHRGGGTEDHTERKKWLVIAKLKRQ